LIARSTTTPQKRYHDLKTMTNSFRCPDSNFIRIHQAVFSLLSELAPDVGISSSFMPPYYLGTSVGYLSNFDLDYVIDDLKYTKSDAIS